MPHSDRPVVDRPLKPGEDPLEWALETARISERSKATWAADLARDPRVVEVLKQLTPVPEMVGGRSVGRVVRRVPQGRSEEDRRAYDANPLVVKALAEWPNLYTATGDQPSLFAGGRDVPPITASGLDPAELLGVPWQARHPIAAEADPAKVYNMLQEYSDDPNMAAMDFGEHGANRAYEHRVKVWTANNMSDDQAYAHLYGEESLARHQAVEAAERQERRAKAERALRTIDAEETN